MFVTKMLVETVNGIGTGGIAGTDFLAKRGHRGLCAAIVMEQRVKNIEGIFRRLPTGKGAKLHREKWPGFADANGKMLLQRAVEIHPGHFDPAGGRQSAVDARHNVNGRIIHDGRSLRGWRSLGEEIHRDGEFTDALHEAWTAKFIRGQPEAMRLKIHMQTAVLAERCAERNAEVGIEGYRTRQRARCGKIAA